MKLFSRGTNDGVRILPAVPLRTENDDVFSTGDEIVRQLWSREAIAKVTEKGTQ